MNGESRPRSARTLPQVVIGLTVVGFGLVMTASNLGWLDSDRVNELIRMYWPLSLVLFGAVRVLTSQDASGRTGGGILVLIGGWLTAQSVYHVRIHFWDWWPLLMIAIGVLMLLRTRPTRGVEVVPGVETTTDQIGSEFAFWSGIRRRVATPNFRRASLTAIMGGIEIDLRPAATATGEAVIDVFVMWGGIEIRVPPDWDVDNQVTAILGGADDKSTGTQAAKHRLVLKGVVVMGGIEIKT